MNASRRNILRAGSFALCGGAALATRGSRSVLAAEVWGADGVRIDSSDGTISTLKIKPEDLDIELAWKGLDHPGDSVTFSLDVSGPESTEYDELFSEDIQLSGNAEGSGAVGADLVWADSGPGVIDLFAADTMAEDDFSVEEPGSEADFSVDFRLSFEHTDGNDSANVSATITVVHTVSVPESDDFEDGTLASIWEESRPSSVNESDGNLTVSHTDHQGDVLPSDGSSWELVSQEGDFDPFRIEARADNAFSGTDDQKVQIGIEGANGVRWAAGWGDEGRDTFRGFEANEHAGGGSGHTYENLERNGSAETADELWIRLEWDGTDLTLYTEQGASFDSWNHYGSVTPSGFTAPMKVGVVGNGNTVSWREFSVQPL